MPVRRRRAEHIHGSPDSPIIIANNCIFRLLNNSVILKLLVSELAKRYSGASHGDDSSEMEHGSPFFPHFVLILSQAHGRGTDGERHWTVGFRRKPRNAPFP